MQTDGIIKITIHELRSVYVKLKSMCVCCTRNDCGFAQQNHVVPHKRVAPRVFSGALRPRTEVDTAHKKKKKKTDRMRQEKKEKG